MIYTFRNKKKLKLSHEKLFYNLQCAVVKNKAKVDSVK